MLVWNSLQGGSAAHLEVGVLPAVRVHNGPQVDQLLLQGGHHVPLLHLQPDIDI